MSSTSFVMQLRPQPKCIIAIDPGVSTGIAIKTEIYYSSTYKNHLEVYELLWSTKPEIVVCEQFTAQRISKYGLHTVRLIGGVEALCTVLGLRLVLQVPQSRLAYVRNARDKIRAMNKHPFTVHEIDALAHLLKFEAMSAKAK